MTSQDADSWQEKPVTQRMGPFWCEMRLDQDEFEKRYISSYVDVIVPEEENGDIENEEIKTGNGATEQWEISDELKENAEIPVLESRKIPPALYQLQYQQRDIKAPNIKLGDDLGQVGKGMLCSNTWVVSSGCSKCLGKKMYLMFLQMNHASDQDHGEILRTLFTIKYERPK